MTEAGKAAEKMPAIDGVNYVFENVAGSISDKSLYASSGLVAIPLGGPYGLEITGAGGSFNDRGIGLAGLNLFWRDPAQGRLGFISRYQYFDSHIGGFNGYHIGGEAEHYFGRFTLSGTAGVSGHASLNGSYNSVPVSVSSKSGFFDEATLKYYPQDNLSLSIGHVYANDKHGMTLGAEYGIPFGTTMAGLFINTSLQSGSTSVMGGLRLYVGQHDKTLIRRNREDDLVAQAAVYIGISLVAMLREYIHVNGR